MSASSKCRDHISSRVRMEVTLTRGAAVRVPVFGCGSAAPDDCKSTEQNLSSCATCVSVKLTPASEANARARGKRAIKCWRHIPYGGWQRRGEKREGEGTRKKQRVQCVGMTIIDGVHTR